MGHRALGWLLTIACTGCLRVTVESSDPIPVAADVQVLAAMGHAYDVAVAAGSDDYLVTWTEHRLHPGDATTSPDIFYVLTSPLAGPVSQGVEFTSYAYAQLQSRPFCSPSGCAIAWGDDAPVGFPDRRILWQNLASGPLVSATEARVTTEVETHQRSATRVGIVGSRAVLAYADTASPAEQGWHASVLDLAVGSVVREIDLGAASWLGSYSVTGGDSSFLVLSEQGDPNDKHQLVAQRFDSEGEPLAAPVVIGERIPPQLARPLVAGFHDGMYIIPVLDFEVVEVDRPCCPECAVVQPPTCVIDDYHIYIVRMSERTGEISAMECLDCRTDVGVNIPQVASTADGVYMFWQDLAARVTATDTPDQPSWRQVAFPDPTGTLIIREFHDVAARPGQLLLVGRERNLAGTDDYEHAFIARVAW